MGQGYWVDTFCIGNGFLVPEGPLQKVVDGLKKLWPREYPLKNSSSVRTNPGNKNAFHKEVFVDLARLVWPENSWETSRVFRIWGMTISGFHQAQIDACLDFLEFVWETLRDENEKG
jgi:hypothetical protein